MRKAFTLIETLISLAIIGAVAAVLGIYGISVSTARAKAAIVSDVQSNARFALDLIQREIRNAANANVLAPSQLELDGVATVIDLDAGRLRITKGASNYMTASGVRVANLLFTNSTELMSIRENIKIEMTVESTGDNPYSYSVVSAQSVRR